MNDEPRVKAETKNAGSWMLQRASGKGLTFKEENSHLS